MSEQTDETGPGMRDGATPISRRTAMRGALGTMAGALIPSVIDLNAARTMAQGAPGPEGPAGPMTYEGLIAQAVELATRPYDPPSDDLPPELAALSYDVYQAIRFRPEHALRLGRRFSAQMFHRGFLQRRRVALFLQPRDGGPRTVAYDPGQFDLGAALSGRSFPASLGFAGFRLHYAFDEARPDDRDEFCVFLGASYFRLRGRGQVYGLSARGVAVGTGGPGAEEFPGFRAFWVVEPGEADATLTVLALLDGPSLSGAYRFSVLPGDPSRIAVEASLHPRRDIARLGLAPLTSMFLYGQNGPGARGAAGFDEFRPQVHDSDGLAVAQPGDRLWRPLTNGRPQPQVSAFRVDPLDGFGLLQRERRFPAYLDVQARHEDRPGLWVSARQGFGAGAVQLYEIPSRQEYDDNVVAAFVPGAPVPAGRPLALAYDLTTVGREPAPGLPDDLARVVSTRVGSAERLRPSNPPSPQRRLYVVDFEGPGLPSDPNARVEVSLSASAGAFVEPYAERVPQTGGWRLYAEYRPPNPAPSGDVVLRARLAFAGRPITETWDAVA